MEFSLHSLHRVDAELETVVKLIRECINVTDIGKMKKNMLMKLNKDVLSGFVESLAGVTGSSQHMLRSAAEQIDALKSENMKLQNSIICLNNDIAQKQSDELLSVKSTVEAEMKTWANVVAESCSNKSAVTPQNLKVAVRTLVSEEDRSRNILVYGAAEGIKEKQLLADIFQQIDTEPEVVEHYRIGTVKDISNRPIKVKLRRPGAVRNVLINAKKLKGHDKLGSIFISPDRSMEERKAHKQLIDEMKKKRNEDPTKYYFIKKGTVCCAERTDGSEYVNPPESSVDRDSSLTGSPHQQIRPGNLNLLSPFEQTILNHAARK